MPVWGMSRARAVNSAGRSPRIMGLSASRSFMTNWASDLTTACSSRPARRTRRPSWLALPAPLGADSVGGVAGRGVGEELGLIEQDTFKLAWIVDFPFYEYDEDEKKVDFAHN